VKRKFILVTVALLLVATGFISGQLVEPLLANRQSTGLETGNGQSVIQTARDLSPCIVGILSYSDQGDFFSQRRVTKSGSGVVIDPSGYIVTNNHVIDGADRIEVSFHDGRRKAAKLIGKDRRTDLALLKVDGVKVTVANFGDSDNLVVGQEVVAIGNPMGEKFARTVTVGVVSGLNRILTTEEGFVFRLIQTDAAINPGNSGGALCNLQGEVIGINTVKIAVSGYEGMGFAIPSNQVVQVINDLRLKGRVERPVAGLQVVHEVTSELATYYNLPVTYGVAVKPIEGGPAHKAGLKDYDIIIAVNGKKVQSVYDLQECLFNCKVGDEATLSVTRLARKSGEQVKKFDCKVTLCSDG